MRHVVALSLFVACTPQLDDHSAILAFSELPKHIASGAKPYAATARDIQRFRGALASTVPSEIRGRVPTYYGQFIGYVDASGQRWIHGNFMCEVDNLQKSFGNDVWKRGYIATNDGGDCFFHVEWSPDTNGTRDLKVNGDA